AVSSSTSATATLTAAANATLGDRVARVISPSGTTNSVPIKVVPPIPAITIGTPVTGTLSATDPASFSTPDANMDLYRFNLTTTTRVVVSLRSTSFDPLLVVRSASTFGTFVSLNDSDGGTNASTAVTLAAGSYLIEATSFLDRQAGNYEVSVQL